MASAMVIRPLESRSFLVYPGIFVQHICEKKKPSGAFPSFPVLFKCIHLCNAKCILLLSLVCFSL